MLSMPRSQADQHGIRRRAQPGPDHRYYAAMARATVPPTQPVKDGQDDQHGGREVPGRPCRGVVAGGAGGGQPDAERQQQGGDHQVEDAPRSANACAADDNRVGLTQGAGANVLVRAESRPAGLKAQQAQKPAVGAGDSGPPTPCCGHRAAHFGKAGPRRHCAARESSQRRSGGIKSLAPGDVITFHDRLQVPGRANDQRGVDMIVAEKVPYLTDGGGQRMSCGSREHQLGCGAQDLIHRSRIRTRVGIGHPLSPPFGVVYGVLAGL